MIFNFIKYNNYLNLMDNGNQENNYNDDEDENIFIKKKNYNMDKNELDKKMIIHEMDIMSLYFYYDHLNHKIDNLKNNNPNNLITKKRNADSLNEKSITNEKSKSNDQTIMNFINPPKKYKTLNNNEIDKNLKIIFKKINSIKDIINLENLEHKYSYIKNKKFKKIIKLIKPLKKLNNMIGIQSIKEQIFLHLCYFIHNNKMDMFHTIITGPPGVGKTELGKILGNIYLSLGILKNNNFIQVKRADLIAGYLGQTAIKTQKVIDSALGGILFIDEAYSLGNKENSDSFSKECIDTINQNLTENKNKFLCIIAGYKTEIEKCFLEYNPGLARRFPFIYNIEKYNYEELLLIFKKKIKENKNIKLNPNINFKKIFKENYEKFKNFGGDIDNLISKCSLFASKRILNNSIDIKFDIEIGEEDLKLAISTFKSEDKNNFFPEYMYI